jgi:hypothetical protein|tara:strand:- start:3 stop:1061 length:1059 start_codon:yes stop_codon:yes gene_type:complete
MVKLKLPIENKKEVNGDLYYMKLAGLNSELSVKSADSPESLIGEGIDYLVIDEAAAMPNKLIWEQYLRPTLSDRQGWCLMVSTPRGFNWWHKLWSRGGDEKFPDWESWQHSSSESPFFKDQIEDLKKELTDETYRQEYEAQFTSFSGKCLPYSDAIHTKTNLKYNPGLPTYVSIDFGYRKPAVVVVQVDHKSKGLPTLYQIDEIAMVENIKTEDLAERVRKLPYNVVAYFGDPAGGGRSSQSGISDIQIFWRKGMRVRFRKDAMTRNVVNGVSHMRRWFEDANGDSHFFVSSKCKGSITSYQNYRYPENRAEQAVKEEPLKDGVHDHVNDALRYLICNLFPIKSRMAGVIDW